MATDLQGRGYHIKDAQTYLGGISQSQLYKLFKSGRLQSYTIGNRRYVTQAVLDKYIAEQTEGDPW